MSQMMATKIEKLCFTFHAVPKFKGSIIFATHLINSFSYIADVFRQMIEYVHTGNVTLQPRTLLGVMNAADYYGLEELKRACSGFVQQGCITVDTVCALLGSAERYIQYKCTKSLVQKVLEFVDEHGNKNSENFMPHNEIFAILLLFRNGSPKSRLIYTLATTRCSPDFR